MSDGNYARPPRGTPVVQVQVADRRPVEYDFRNNTLHSTPSSASHTGFRATLAHYTDVGIIRDTLLPSLVLNTSLSTIAWATGRSLNRLELKDYLWPTSQIVNVWWSALGRKIFLNGRSLSAATATLSWPERLLLTGVTAWGGRLLYRVVSRSIARGADDPRYETAKKQARDLNTFWNSALLNVFLPEALFQTLIALPLTAPFRHQGGALTGYHPNIQAAAVGLFSVGFALEVFADAQLEAHKMSARSGLLRDGVWSIVRHPNYLGDILIHFSFPLLLYGSDLLRPIELLGPLANYIFLRYIGGDAENEANQAERYAKEDFEKRRQLEDYRQEKNSIWPSLGEVGNTWTWIVLGCGMLGVVIEEGLRRVVW